MNAHQLRIYLLSSAFTFATIPILAQVSDTTLQITKIKTLITNPSFEQHTDCPQRIDATGTLTLVKDWTQPTAGSADYFHPCGGKECGVPRNKLGKQHPHSGEAYCGIYCSKSEYREYLQTELVQPLDAGTIYEIEFYVSLSERSTGAVATLGALLTQEPVSDTSRKMLLKQEQQVISKRITQTFLTEYHPQVVNSYDNLLLNTDDWMRVHGQFTAQGGERYLTIGNFSSAEHSNLVFPETLENTLPGAYYYIDDVNLYPICKSTLPKLVQTSSNNSIENSNQPQTIIPELEINSTFVLREIYFDLDKSILLEQSHQELAKLQHLMDTHPQMRIEIIGHTDDQGSETYNQQLSENRAKAVVEYLVKHGIQEQRLSFKGMGKTQPLVPNDSEDNRALNRRVEFKIIEL